MCLFPSPDGRSEGQAPTNQAGSWTVGISWSSAQLIPLTRQGSRACSSQSNVPCPQVKGSMKRQCSSPIPTFSHPPKYPDSCLGTFHFLGVIPPSKHLPNLSNQSALTSGPTRCQRNKPTFKDCGHCLSYFSTVGKSSFVK